MGNKSQEQSESFGDVFLDVAGNFAILPCSFHSPLTLQIIVQDKQGCAVLNENFNVDESTQELNLKIQDVAKGEYHAWIYYEGKIVLKGFTVESSRSNGRLSRFMGLFN